MSEFLPCKWKPGVSATHFSLQIFKVDMLCMYVLCKKCDGYRRLLVLTCLRSQVKCMCVYVCVHASITDHIYVYLCAHSRTESPCPFTRTCLNINDICIPVCVDDVCVPVSLYISLHTKPRVLVVEHTVPLLRGCAKVPLNYSCMFF